ncbi:MAG: PAS domain-containing protein, partial [Clostridiaceae bacterium]|nr:PAS domain-containing protein [Clostridiaceae bacterium]
MSNLTNANSNNAYFITKNNIIETTNNLLYKMVGYHSLINMNIEDFWKLIKLEKHNKYYKITSRSSKVTEVYINEYDLLNVDECLYIFNVKKNYEFEGCSKVLNQLFSDKINGIGIFSLPDLNLIECNKMYLDFLDEPYNSIKSPIGESIFEIISDFEGSSLYEVWENTIETKKSTSLKSIQFFDSEKDCIVYWDMLIAPVDIFDESYLCVIIVDVTENMSNKFQLEQQSLTINKQNRKLEAIIEAMSGCINIIDNKGNFTKKSSLLEDFFEFDENNKIKYELSEFYDINENPISYENNIIYQLLSGNEIIDYKQILKNKDITKYAMVNGKPIFDESGDFEMGVFITNDITEIITQGKIIEEQSKKAQVIIDNISDGLYIVDNNFNITLLNNSAKDIFYEADAIKKLSDSFKHTRYYDMENKLISLEDMPEYRALRGAKVSDYRITAHRPEGKYNFSFSGSPIYDEKGKITMAIICCR